MIMLPDRCEFLSDAWLDEARKFLERECRNRKERARDTHIFSQRAFSTNAPPHLKFADGVATWSMRCGGRKHFPCRATSMKPQTWSWRVIIKQR